MIASALVHLGIDQTQHVQQTIYVDNNEPMSKEKYCKH